MPAAVRRPPGVACPWCLPAAASVLVAAGECAGGARSIRLGGCLQQRRRVIILSVSVYDTVSVRDIGLRVLDVYADMVKSVVLFCVVPFLSRAPAPARRFSGSFMYRTCAQRHMPDVEC